MISSARTLLRSLRGAPLSVLIALALFGPQNRKELIVNTGWKKGAVDDALAMLEGEGWVIRPSYRQWALSDGCRQLPLFNYPLNGPSGSYPQVVHNIAESPENGPSDLESPESGLSPLVSSSSNNKLTRETLPEPDTEILEACTEVGIYGRKRLELACLVHVVAAGPDYVRGHVKNVNGQIGLAIWRLEQGWSLPNEETRRAAVPDGYELVDGVLQVVDVG